MHVHVLHKPVTMLYNVFGMLEWTIVCGSIYSTQYIHTHNSPGTNKMDVNRPCFIEVKCVRCDVCASHAVYATGAANPEVEDWETEDCDDETEGSFCSEGVFHMCIKSGGGGGGRRGEWWVLAE